MNKNELVDAIKELLLELQKITVQTMATTGVKTSSDISKSIKYVITKDGVQMVANDYYTELSEGRSTTKRRALAHRIPLDVLIKWIKAKNILPRNQKTGRFITINQFAWAIQTSIYKHGLNSKRAVKGKKFADKVENNVADYMANQLADKLAEAIANELVLMFAPVTNNQ